METLSFVLPAKTTIGLIVMENCGFGGKNKTQSFQTLFFLSDAQKHRAQVIDAKSKTANKSKTKRKYTVK